MSDFYWLLSFVNAFFSTVIVGCSQPNNWDQCFPVNNWFIPWLHDAIHLVEDGAYHQERVDLQIIESSDSMPD